MWFECSPIFVRFIFSIHSPKAYLVLYFFVNNVISKLYIPLVGLGITIYGSDISELLNVIENSINWCFHIKSNLFGHILMLGKHLRCDFAVGIEDMLEDYVNFLLDSFSIVIAQISNAL